MTDSPTVCDFCSDPDPLWSYPCPDFPLFSFGVVGKSTITPGYDSVGPWLACASCSFFIDADMWTELRDHAVRRYTERYPGMVGTIASSLIKVSHFGFQEHVEDDAIKEPWPDAIEVG